MPGGGFACVETELGIVLGSDEPKAYWKQTHVSDGFTAAILKLKSVFPRQKSVARLQTAIRSKSRKLTPMTRRDLRFSYLTIFPL